jgi:hypothetical protein
MKDTHIGSTFESFLEEQGLKEEVDLLAQKRVIAWQLEQAMAEEEITKADMAARMKTSRTQVERLLDPQNNRVQLDTLQRAALAVGRSLKVELVKTAQTVHVDRTVERAHARRGSKMAARTRAMRTSRPKAKTRKTVAK